MTTAASRARPLVRGAGGQRASRHGLAAVGVLLVAAWISVEGHGGHVLEALPETLLAGAASVFFFAITGYPAARLLAPRWVAPHLMLLVLPLGAACSSLALTFLGFLNVPFDAALAAVLFAGVGGSVLARARLGRAELSPDDARGAGGLAIRLLWPAFVALTIAGLTLLPSFRIGALTVPGENPDAHLVTGAAEVVQAGPPTAVQPDLPVDRVSDFWRSKYPIYYSLAAVSRLSGLDPAEAFPVLSAVVLLLFSAGVLLFAYHALGAGPGWSLAAMALVSMDRVVLYLVVHPYYNQLWGTFALPFVLLFGLRFLRQPDRRLGALTLLFLAVGVFAYPLMLPFPAVALGVAAIVIWRRRRAAGEPVGWLAALRLPRLRRRWLLAPVVVVVLTFAVVLTAAAIDKVVEAAKVIVPGGDLAAWQGDSPDYPFARYFGLDPAPGVAALALVLLVVAALRRIGRAERLALAAMGGAALLMAIEFRFRRFGEYFEFKVLAFLGPLALMLAVVGLGSLAAGTRRRLAAAYAGALALFVVAVVGVRDELDAVAPQSPPEVFELREWAKSLPGGASVRIDVPASGVQLWAAYMLHERPLSASVPVLGTTYPHVPAGRKADYVLVESWQPRPREAVGSPVRRNAIFRLYRMDPEMRGRDTSSRVRVSPRPGLRGGL